MILVISSLHLNSDGTQCEPLDDAEYRKEKKPLHWGERPGFFPSFPRKRETSLLTWIPARARCSLGRNDDADLGFNFYASSWKRYSPAGRSLRPPGHGNESAERRSQPAESAKNLPLSSIGGRLLFSTEPPRISSPVGVMRVAAPALGLSRVPAATRSTTRLPAPVLR